MDIIFRPHYFGGKNNNFDDVFVPLCLKSALISNPNSNVYFISNYSNIKERFFLNDNNDNIDYSKLNCFTFEEFECDKTKEIYEKYIHLSTNPFMFEKYAIISYFYIYNLMTYLNITETIVVETDVMVFCDLTEKIKKHFDIENIDSLLSQKCVIECCYIKKIYLETFINTTLRLYSDDSILDDIKKIYSQMSEGGICDMTINDYIHNGVYNGLFKNLNMEKKNIKIEELSYILNDNSYFDPNFSILHELITGDLFDNEIHIELGEMKKIYYIDNMPYFKLNGNLIKCNCIHFQGHKKGLIPEVYKICYSNKI